MSLHRYFEYLRVLLILVGVGLFASGLNTVASMPMGPPESDGFIEGLAYIYAILIGGIGLLLVQIGYVLPTGSGRLQIGPLTNRSPATRGGITAIVYLLIAFVMVYGIPLLVPGVTASMTYATGLFVFVIAGGAGIVVTVVLTVGNLTHRLMTET